MKITNINFRNMKTAYFNSSIKLNNGKTFVSFKSQPAFDRFTGKSSRTEKAIELHNLLNNRVQKPDVIIKRFSQYTGDDYEAAKILAASIKEDKNGLHFSLSKEDKDKIKRLEPECPYLQTYIASIE